VEQDGVLNYIKNSESVTVPKEFKARENAPATKLAYITAEEAKMLKKMKKGTPHKGPKGIPSYDSFDAQGNFTSGAAMSAAETGSRNQRDRAEVRASNIGAPKGAGPGVRSNQERDLRSSFIAAGAGQRVNPGFFDSKNVISPFELAMAKQYANRPENLFAKRAMRNTRGGGIMDFITSGGIIGNLIRGLGQRFGLGKKFNEPTYDMRQFSGINPNNLDIYNEFVDDEDDNQIPIVIDNDMSLIPRKNLNDYEGVTPFQKDVIEDTQDQADDPFLKDAIAFKPGSIKDRQLKQMYNIFQETGMENPNMRNLMQEDIEEGGDLSLPADAYRMLSADGGMIGGGIMDAAGRQNYFLGKLVKKATRAVKKIVKSPVGKLGLGALLLGAGGGFKPSGFLRKTALPFLMENKALAGAIGLSAAPLLFQKEEEQGEGLGTTGSVGGQIDPRAYTDPYGVLFGAFKAEGGSMKDEPVAKRTMPLLDMGGQEMDLRAEGGFVPIGRMEKADDVPARLSKNEFVFTADAVRNAGDGDVDKGAEVMYNMMKNLEAGGEVSEESQGLEGARNMFQTSKRLEEVI
jgi:hypothetical protein